MPEAAVDEDDRAVSRQDDIRTPRKSLVVYTVAKPQSPKGITQTQLRLGGGGVDLRHDVVSLLGGKDVGQMICLVSIKQRMRRKITL